MLPCVASILIFEGEKTMKEWEKLSNIRKLGAAVGFLVHDGMSLQAMLANVEQQFDYHSRATDKQAAFTYRERLFGTVLWYDSERHIGRIQGNNGRHYFVALDDANCDERILVPFAVVTFNVSPAVNGKLPNARDIKAKII